MQSHPIFNQNLEIIMLVLEEEEKQMNLDKTLTDCMVENHQNFNSHSTQHQNEKDIIQSVTQATWK